jgi:TRAP-type C4-dicarboxylate transport system permease small subunit
MNGTAEKNHFASHNIWHFFDKFINFLAFLSGILIVSLILIILYEVIMRYFIHKPVGWVVEICEYILLYITFLGVTWLLREGGHISVDIILNSLNINISNIIIRINSIVGAIACLFIVYYGISHTYHLYELKTMVIQTLNTPKWVLLAIIPFGSLLAAIQFIRNAFSSK